MDTKNVEKAPGSEARDVFHMLEVNVREERGIILLSQKFESLRELSEDEEALYMLALTYTHPEWAEEIISQIKKHKPHVQNPAEIRDKLVSKLSEIERESKITSSGGGIAQWQNRIDEISGRIRDLISYFRPNPSTSRIDKLVIIPSDNVLLENEGRSFHVGGDVLIMSPSGNSDNLDHEFLHAIINPIIEKIYGNLTDEQKKKITSLASRKLKRDYGDYPLSLLAETVIRTYNDYVKHGRELTTSKDFFKRVDSMTNEDFSKSMSSERLRSAFEELGIRTLDDLRAKKYECYERFVKDELAERMYALYQNYENNNEEGAPFEDFLIKHVDDLLV